MNVQGPDGAVIAFPDEMPPEQIKSAMQKRYGGPAAAKKAEPLEQAPGLLTQVLSAPLRKLASLGRPSELQRKAEGPDQGEVQSATIQPGDIAAGAATGLAAGVSPALEAARFAAAAKVGEKIDPLLQKVIPSGGPAVGGVSAGDLARMAAGVGLSGLAVGGGEAALRGGGRLLRPRVSAEPVPVAVPGELKAPAAVEPAPAEAAPKPAPEVPPAVSPPETVPSTKLPAAPEGAGATAAEKARFQALLKAKASADALETKLDAVPEAPDIPPGSDASFKPARKPAAPAPVEPPLTGDPMDRLTAALDTLPDETPIRERRNVVERAALSGTKAKDEMGQALAKLRANAAAMWNWYSRPPQAEDYSRAVNQHSYNEALSNDTLGKYVKQIERKVPNKADREAINVWMQAGGDTGVLAEQARRLRDAKVPDEYIAPYEAAAKGLKQNGQAVAPELRTYLDARKAQLIDAGYLTDEGAKDNYMRQLWDLQRAPVPAGATVGGGLKTRPDFLKRSVFPTYFDGLMAGYRPKNMDAGYLVGFYDREFNRFLNNKGLLRSLETGVAEDGRPILAKSAEADADYLPGGHWSLQPYRVHPKYLTKLQNALNIGQKGLADIPWIGAVAKPTLRFNRGLKEALFSGSGVKIPEGVPVIGGKALGFHSTTLGAKAMSSGVNPFNVPDFDYNEPHVQKLMLGGATLGNRDALMEFSEGVASARWTDKIPYIGPWFHAYQDWLFTSEPGGPHSYLDRLKVHTARTVLEHLKAKYPKLSEDQLYKLTADYVSTYGGVNWKALGANKATRDIMSLVFLAPDFTVARWRGYGQGAMPFGAAQRRSLLTQALALWTGARVMNMVANDGDPQYDLPFGVKVGGHTFGIRSDIGDLWNAASGPVKEAVGIPSPSDDFRLFGFHRLSGASKAIVEAASGRDEFGRPRGVAKQLMDVVRSGIPIPVQAMVDERGRPLWESFVSTSGVAAYPYHTPAERLASQYSFDAGKRETPEDQQRYELHRLVREQLRENGSSPIAIEAMKNGKLSQQEMGNIQKTVTQPDLLRHIERLPAKELLDVWSMAKPYEKVLMRPQLAQRADRLSRTPQDRITEQTKRDYRAIVEAIREDVPFQPDDPAVQQAMKILREQAQKQQPMAKEQ